MNLPDSIRLLAEIFLDATYEVLVAAGEPFVQGAADLSPGTHECHVTAIERRVNKNGAPHLHITLTIGPMPPEALESEE